MKFLNKIEVKKKLRDNLNIKSQFSNTLYTRRVKGKAFDNVDKINSWILKYSDLICEDEIRKIKNDFPEKCCNPEFIYMQKMKFLKFIKEKAEKKILNNHCRFVSKQRMLLK
tara:strand:- start:588 stop:923 length:336 start_codon:yes stop_codon:yes gene_type:complete